jgi:hypothetical protein
MRFPVWSRHESVSFKGAAEGKCSTRNDVERLHNHRNCFAPSSQRHCEELLRRSNPGQRRKKNWIASSQELLAMTNSGAAAEFAR